MYKDLKKRAKSKRQYRSSHPDHQRACYLRSQHGLELWDYEEWLVKQNGVCAICKHPETVGDKHLAVDHDHAANKIRGLLCQKCNVSLGNFKDDPVLLLSALDYLRRNGH